MKDGVGGVIATSCSVCEGSGSLTRGPPRTKLRPVKEFKGWTSPGPDPLGDPLPLVGCEELCSLTGRWKILQKTDSHRYSTDDVCTAWVASRVVRSVFPGGRIACADIGCGIGSVLLMSAWLFPEALCCVGVEAQPSRLALAQRSISFNLGASAQLCSGSTPTTPPSCRIVAAIQGDLRDPAVLHALREVKGGGEFHLVTGTPPYFKTASGGTPPHEESARCLFEYRGGVEAYLSSAAALLAPGGVFCCCQTSLELSRTYAAALEVGLKIIGRVETT